MFDKIFSPQWILDRCFEGWSTFLWITLLIAIILGVITFLTFKKKSKRLLIGAAIGLATFVSSLILILILFLVIGYGVVGCTMGSFWASITPAHQLHALLKQYKAKTGTYPQDEGELRNLSPSLYEKIKANSKEVYIYNPTIDTYMWVIRPSYYYVVVFDSYNDYVMYRIPHLINLVHSSFSVYPSNYPLLK